jgi:hypothetical protein
MRNLVVAAVVLAVLAPVRSAEAQTPCRCGTGPRTCQSYNYAPWQSPPMPCWTGTAFCNPCPRCVCQECVPCYQQTTWEPSEVEVRVVRLEDEVEKLRKRVADLEKKAKIKP